MSRFLRFLGSGSEQTATPRVEEEEGSRLVVRNTFFELVETKSPQRPAFRRAKTDTNLLQREDEEEYSLRSGSSDDDTAAGTSGHTTAESEDEHEHDDELRPRQAEVEVAAPAPRGPVPAGLVQTSTATTGALRAKGRSSGQSKPKTTVMLRNLPNNYNRTMLLDMLNAEGFEGKYDFVYLPVDFKSNAGLGYAFVNLVDPEIMPRFWAALDGYKAWTLPTSKVCAVGWSDPHQGLKANIQRYRNSPVMHESIPDECKPVLFADGVRIPFPKPTKALQAPRRRARN